MGQLEFIKGQELTSSILCNVYNVTINKTVVKVVERPDRYIAIYEDNMNRLIAKNTTDIVPDLLFIDNNKLIYTNFIEVELKYFSNLIDKVKEFLPYIYDFIIGENIESIKIKPSFVISDTGDKKRIEIGMADVETIQQLLLDPNNANSLDSLVLFELIRKFYIGEKDSSNGLLIYKPFLKYIKVLFEEGITAEYILNKIISNSNIVDNNNFFRGTQDKYRFSIFNNIILRTTNKKVYEDNLDLKFLSMLETMGKLLNEKRFGRR